VLSACSRIRHWLVGKRTQAQILDSSYTLVEPSVPFFGLLTLPDDTVTQRASLQDVLYIAITFSGAISARMLWILQKT